MKLHHHTSVGRLAAVLAVVLMSAVACHGTPTSTGYVPTGSSGVSMPQTLPGMSSEGIQAKIISSCGTKIRIVLLGSVDCKFHENNHPKRTFKLSNHTQGIVLISPTSGNKLTVFTITAVVLGNGYFTVKDDVGNKLNVTVQVVT